ncbi:hypothetical protein [Alkalibaculum bacchi]|uniref:hypothetical protein n=1 Tax=Alkalibaculum bacchi TaxID=645887 RepID=UPI0026F19894|nr:hypothetical protein [Alkalibaculum bacchi]
MSKLVIALSATLTGILLFGYNYQNTPKYAAEEISKINKDIIRSVYSLEEARRARYTDDTIDESEDKIAPVIEIVYPEEFKHGETVETDKVELKFSDNVKVVKARMNNLTIPTDTVRITTTGTYNIEIEDEAKNKTRLVFTINQEAIKSEEAKKAEEQKKAQEEAERKAKVAAEKKAQQAASGKAQEEQKKAQAEAARIAEAERIAQEEAARKAEAERIAQEEAARKAEEERIAQEEAARKAEEEKAKQEQAEQEQNGQGDSGQAGNDEASN